MKKLVGRIAGIWTGEDDGDHVYALLYEAPNGRRSIKGVGSSAKAHNIWTKAKLWKAGGDISGEYAVRMFNEEEG